jgi:hypothetical protein
VEPDIDLWVLTCAPASRIGEAYDLFESLDTPIDRRVLVTTDPDPVYAFDGHLVHYHDTDINISNWWNLGLDAIASHYEDGNVWDVLLAESDARQDPAEVERLRFRMRLVGAVMAGGDWEHTLGGELDGGGYVRTSNLAKPVGRIPGILKVVAGETGIRHDPDFRWWLADDDYEWQHRVAGGTFLAAGMSVQHTGTQGPLTGDRLRYWEEDQVKFFDKWGGMPATNGIVS